MPAELLETEIKNKDSSKVSSPHAKTKENEDSSNLDKGSPHTETKGDKDGVHLNEDSPLAKDSPPHADLDKHVEPKSKEGRQNGGHPPSSRKIPRDEATPHDQRKAGKVSEGKFLMDVAWEVGDRWEELGVGLGLEYKVLQSVVGSQTGKPDHMKAFYMLCEWKSRAGFKATYDTLADALEGTGLNSCAEKYCYKD